MLKKALIHIRTSIKLIIIIAISVFLAIGLVAFIYKPIYSVTINGEFVGYSGNKSDLQKKINTYIDSDEDKNVAFIQVDLPEYKLCLLKKNIVTNDDEIFDIVKNSGTPYYKYYAILSGQEEKIYVSDFETAEAIVAGLKEKNSSNISGISIIEKYETELKDFTTKEEAIASLYVKPVAVASTKKTTAVKSTGSVSTSTNISSQKVSIGVALSRPISGTITSRFGERSSVRSSAHTGLDIAAPKGTAIGAAASGTVTFAGYKGSYGNLIVISHGNGVETYYGHCNAIYVSAGETIKQGQTIGAVGSTGNSTGYHLHLEVRVNGVAYNPQNYVY